VDGFLERKRAIAQNGNVSAEDADRATILKDILSTLIPKRNIKEPQPTLNISRGSVDVKLFPAKLGEVDIVLINPEEIKKQEEFIYYEFDNFRLRRFGLEALIAKMWESCSGYGGHDRYFYSYKKVGEKWEGGRTEEVELNNWHGPSRCKKK